MKIAVFIKSTTFHKGHGGLETQNKVLCEGLAARGHAITVFSPKKELDIDTCSDNNVTYIFVPCDSKYMFSGVNHNSWQNRSYEEFLKYHKVSKFDLVLGQSSGAIGIILKKQELDVKIVSIAHGTTLGEFKTTFSNIQNIKDLVRLVKNFQYVIRQYFGRQRDYVLKSNHMIAVSNAVKNALIEETYIPENWVTVINNGIDPAHIQATLAENRSFNGNTVFYVGQITKDKGMDYLVKIFNEYLQSFPDKNAPEAPKLVVAGDGPILQQLKDSVISVGTGEKIKFLGKIPYASIFTYYTDPSVSVFAFPTNRVEGFPMVLVEAMFAGLPIVAFNCGGVSDAVVNNETGYLIPEGNKSDYSDKLFSLLKDHEKLKEFSIKAREKALKEFTIDVMIDKYEQVFKEILK